MKANQRACRGHILCGDTQAGVPGLPPGAFLSPRACNGGRFDPDIVTAVVQAAGQRAPRIERPAGLTEREAEVVGMLARGLQTKQVARALGISVKTADRHVQNSYGKIGVSTRAAAALFAMEHGLIAWGELPIAPRRLAPSVVFGPDSPGRTPTERRRPWRSQ
jgi:DNA-binding CsgD family transcriptional regulator